MSINTFRPETSEPESSPADVAELARQIRVHVVQMTAKAESSHVGSALSCADIVAALYGGVLRYDPANPDWPERDRLVFSKGHAGATLYAALARCGYFPVDQLDSYYADGSALSGHVSHVGVPGVELSTGSLGHGLSVAAGMALASQRRSLGYRTFVVMSDGECDEGAVWEAAMFAAHHQLSSLFTVIDYNKLQSLASTSDTLDLEPFVDKWRAFGWDTTEVDGHDLDALRSALDVVPTDGGPPHCVIAHTVKGRGVSFMEGSVLWHYRFPRVDDVAQAVAEINGTT
jgi:transketolase